MLYKNILGESMKGLHINPKDNVIIALEDAHKNDLIENIALLEDINAGHKVALIDISENEDIIKYGEVIGHAIKPIKQGEKIHTHNMKTSLSGVNEYQYTPIALDTLTRKTSRDLYAYKRYNNKVGIRNELWIVVSVGCVNSIALNIIDEFKKTHDLNDIDGIYTFAHPYGCSQMGDDQDNTIQILKNIVTHPNAGGVLVLGLGCENNQPKAFYESLGDIDKNRIKYLVCQDVDNEVEAGCAILDEIYEKMRYDRREKVEYSDITFGLKCGGSDGFSGITANPLVGNFSDYMLSYGTNSILTEVPEMFGAEHILMNRAKDKKTFDSIVNLINQYKEYFIANNQVVYENPSPGNKAGGITTLEEKSLGCIQKAGTSIINDVLQYGEKQKTPGVSLLYGPGNDMVSVTAMGASGCQLVLFTTGRGTPFGGFIPTVKISTNTKLYEHKQKWLDFNAGVLLDGTSFDEATDLLINKIIDIINGEKTCNEKNNCREIAILKQGVTL